MNPNLQDLEGKTALHYAVINGARIDIIDSLINTFGKKLDKEIIDLDGKKAIQYTHNKEVIDRLNMEISEDEGELEK